MGVKNGKAYFIMEEHSQKEKSTKNPGAQLGHKGHFRRTPKVTERVTLKAGEFTCPMCSSPLVRKGIRKRVIEDIPEIRPRVVQYRIERMYCKNCGKTYEPQMPEALPNTRLSLRAMLIASYFRIAMRMSLENVSVTMKEVFGLKISEVEVQEILYQLSDALGDEYRSLLKSIRKAPSRNMDTTSYRIDGENCDLWTFVTKGEAIFIVAESNSHEVALKVLGKHNGTDVHDRFSAFETLASKTHNDQKYCWAHIISDARELESFYGNEGRRMKKSLKSIYNKAKSFNGNGTSEDVDRLYDRLIFLLDTGYEHLRSRKSVEKLLKRRKEWLFRFVVDPSVDSTNNRAERALRPAVIYRKTSGGSRSDRGASTYARLHSIFYTTKIRKKSFIRDVPGMIRRGKPHPG